jgi:hypothetical protein
VQILNLFPEGVAVQAKQLGSLDLVAFSFLQGLGDEGPFNSGNQHRMKIASRAVSHAFDKVSHLPFHIVFKAHGRGRAVRHRSFGAGNRLHELRGPLQHRLGPGDDKSPGQVDVMRQSARSIVHAGLGFNDHGVECSLRRVSRQCSRIFGGSHRRIFKCLPEVVLDFRVAAEQQDTEDRRRERHEAITRRRGPDYCPEPI